MQSYDERVRLARQLTLDLPRAARLAGRRPRRAAATTSASRTASPGTRVRASPTIDVAHVDARIARGVRRTAQRRDATQRDTHVGRLAFTRPSANTASSSAVNRSSCCAAASAKRRDRGRRRLRPRRRASERLPDSRTRRSARPSRRAPRGRARAGAPPTRALPASAADGARRHLVRQVRVVRRGRVHRRRIGRHRLVMHRRLHVLRDDRRACRRSRAGRTGSVNFSSYCFASCACTSAGMSHSFRLNGPSAFLRDL